METIFCLDSLIYKNPSECCGASQRDYSFMKCNIHRCNKQLASLILHVNIVLKRRRFRGCRDLQCREKRTELQGWEGRDAEGEMETISRLLPPASLFQASVPQQLSEERQIKVRRDRQAKETRCHRRAPVSSTYF